MSERYKTKYPHVFYQIAKTGEWKGIDKVYYLYFSRNGKPYEKRVGSQHVDGMTPVKAYKLYNRLISGRSIPDTLAPDKPERTERRTAKRSQWTLDDIWETYQENKIDWRGNTNDVNRYWKHIHPLFGSKLPGEIEELEVDKYKAKLLKTYKKSTVNNILELLRRTCNWGARKIKENGQSIGGLQFKIEMVRNVDNEVTGYLNQVQRRNLITLASEHHDKQIGNFILFLFYSGCRKGEAFKLRWEDVKWDQGVIELLRTKAGEKQYIPLTGLLRELLESHPKTESPYVFPGKYGGMKTDCARAVKAVFRAAGLPNGFRVHDLRHAYASALAEKGVEMGVISKLLRHSSVVITEKRYVRFSPDFLGNRAEVIADVVKEACGSPDH
jgi:integrase